VTPDFDDKMSTLVGALITAAIVFAGVALWAVFGG